MDKDVKKHTRLALRESFEQKMMENPVQLQEKKPKKKAEPDTPKEDEDTISSDRKGRYEKIQQLLANEIFNTAEICNRLWGSKDGTNRSLFKKKLDQATNDTGDVYEFDDEELAKISSILRDTSRSITKTVGRKGA